MARTDNAQNAYARIAEKLNAVLEDTHLFSAYLYEYKAKSGRLTCKCANTSFRHTMWCVLFSEDGRSGVRVVPIEQLSQVRDMTEACRRLKKDLGDDDLTKSGTASFNARLDKTLLALHLLLSL